MILVLLGPPGAGKGTQAADLAASVGLTHLSTGELFRAHLREGTPLGETAQAYMARGELVPDEVVVGMVGERLADGGSFVLDGFPRTVAQAEALDTMIHGLGMPAPSALALEVPRAEVLSRLTGRRVCEAEGHVYHVTYRPPQVAGVCDIDGSALIQRADDSEATVARRLEVYEADTKPVLEYYAAAGRLLSVDGMGSAAEVQTRLRSVLPMGDPA